MWRLRYPLRRRANVSRPVERRTVTGDAVGREHHAAAPPGRKRSVYRGHRGYLNSVEASPSHAGAHRAGPSAICALHRADPKIAVSSAHVVMLSLTAEVIEAVVNRSRQACSDVRPPLRSVSALFCGVNEPRASALGDCAEAMIDPARDR